MAAPTLKLVITALAAALAHRAALAENNPFADTAGSTTQYYRVEGCSEDEIRRALNKNGPTDQFGRPRDAYTYWHVWWSWPSDSKGKPDYSRTVGHQEIRVHLPEWDPASCERAGNLEIRWKNFLDAIVRHEKRHVAFVNTGASRVAKEIQEAFRRRPQLTTLEANAVGQQVLDGIRQQDRRYDEETDSGRREGVKFP